ncbi:HTH_48 domain-containing protein [Trichonephila clavipes]|nr:HTH_48 domain-containing protein [Trichonephila clavipes]
MWPHTRSEDNKGQRPSNSQIYSWMFVVPDLVGCAIGILDVTYGPQPTVRSLGPRQNAVRVICEWITSVYASCGTVLRGRNAMECHSQLVEALGNNALPGRAVARWIGKFQQRRLSTGDEQRSGRFTHGAANAEADGIQCLPYRWQCVVIIARDYIEGL